MNFSPLSPLPAPSLTILGDVGIDIVMGPLDGWPEIGTESMMPRSEMRAGGSAGNAALAAASLGASVRLISAVGSDPLGLWLKGQFDGIAASWHVLESATSLSVGMIHQNGERNFFTTHGHLEMQAWDRLAPALSPPPTPHVPGIILLTGAFLLPNLRRDYPILLRHLRDLGYQIALDTGWPPEGFTPAVINEVKVWLPLVDHVLLNELEITRVAADDNLNTAMATLSALLRPNASLIAKVGREGAIGWRDTEKASARPPETGIIFDTIGAGDAFNAGYLHAITQGSDLSVALTSGCATATHIIANFPRHIKAAAWQTGV
jgi:sugar/nucleoside kinase (ribokinase family)